MLNCFLNAFKAAVWNFELYNIFILNPLMHTITSVGLESLASHNQLPNSNLLWLMLSQRMIRAVLVFNRNLLFQVYLRFQTFKYTNIISNISAKEKYQLLFLSYAVNRALQWCKQKLIFQHAPKMYEALNKPKIRNCD